MRIYGEPGCAHGYRKPFLDNTLVDLEDNRVEFRRRDDGRSWVNKHGDVITNRDIVPHHRESIVRFDTHICTLVIATMYAIRYMFTYCVKEQARGSSKLADQCSLG